jgi:hypothetical protein
MLKNSNCDKSYESCAKFTPQNTGGPLHVCVLSSYCGKTSGLVWGPTKSKITDKIDCQDGKREDKKSADNKAEAKKREDAKQKHATDNNLKIVGKGKKCAKPGKKLEVSAGKYFFNTAAECSAKAAAESSKCNFFMYSTDYPVAGCFCCDKYDAVDDTGKDAKSYDVYQTCVDKAKPTKSQSCFNKVNVDKHNEYRKMHSKAGETGFALKHSDKLAKEALAYAKTLLAAGRLTPAPASALKWKDGKLCGESLMEFPSKSEVDPNYTNSAMLTESFYAGRDVYDPDTHGIPSTASEDDAKKAAAYAQLLWRATTEVGFGIAGNFAVARYCAGGNTPAGDAAAYALNVCPKDGCAKCPTKIKGLGYDNCYNKRALTAANIKRAAAQSTDLKLDTAVAIKAQAWADILF